MRDVVIVVTDTKVIVTIFNGPRSVEKHDVIEVGDYVADLQVRDNRYRLPARAAGEG